MTKDIAIRLLKFESNLNSGIKSSYVRLNHEDWKEFFDIYLAYYGIGLSASEKTCNSCRLRAVKRIGTEYFNYKDWYKKRYGVELSLDSNLTQTEVSQEHSS